MITLIEFIEIILLIVAIGLSIICGRVYGLWGIIPSLIFGVMIGMINALIDVKGVFK
jgi:hypothetical protein